MTNFSEITGHILLHQNVFQYVSSSQMTVYMPSNVATSFDQLVREITASKNMKKVMSFCSAASLETNLIHSVSDPQDEACIHDNMLSVMTRHETKGYDSETRIEA
jgi:hypothetical protein